MDPSLPSQSLPKEQYPVTPPASPLPTPPGFVDTQAFTPLCPLDSAQSTPPHTPRDHAPIAILLTPGMVVDGYEILEFLGRGGMGVVYQARQPHTGQTVALKMIRDGVCADPIAFDRFLREVQGLGRVQPVKNIVSIFHRGQHQGLPYYVMPFLAGGSLAAHKKRYQDEPRQAVALVEKIARAVQQLHAHGILHRDIKPGNI